LRAALVSLNPELPDSAIQEAIDKLIHTDFTRSVLQHNQEFHALIRDGVPVSVRDADGETRRSKARVIDVRDPRSPHNRFLAVRELKLTGLRAPSYNRRADFICFVNGLPLVFIELSRFQEMERRSDGPRKSRHAPMSRCWYGIGCTSPCRRQPFRSRKKSRQPIGSTNISGGRLPVVTSGPAPKS
jgi:hypothetical protein